jgi:hypothetical protein
MLSAILGEARHREAGEQPGKSVAVRRLAASAIADALIDSLALPR